MKKLFVWMSLGIFLLGFPFVILSNTKKECRNAEKTARFEKAKDVLKSMTFGVQPDYQKVKGGFFDLNHDQKSFLGFEDKKLVLQGNFYGPRGIFDVSNYVYREDNKGNVVVTFDFSGRISNGKIEINMKSGDNYAEIYLRLKSWNGIYTGNILHSEDIDYIYEVTTI